MLGIDLRVSGVGSDSSANCATTTAELYLFNTLQLEYPNWVLEAVKIGLFACANSI